MWNINWVTTKLQFSLNSMRFCFHLNGFYCIVYLNTCWTEWNALEWDGEDYLWSIYSFGFFLIHFIQSMVVWLLRGISVISLILVSAYLKMRAIWMSSYWVPLHAEKNKGKFWFACGNFAEVYLASFQLILCQ